MRDPFLDDLLAEYRRTFEAGIVRDAPRPRKPLPWFLRWPWVIPTGLCFGFALTAFSRDMPATGVGFVVAGVAIRLVFGGEWEEE